MMDGLFINVQLGSVVCGCGRTGHCHIQINRRLDSIGGWMVTSDFTTMTMITIARSIR